ncbi:aminoimidazole riboside kinase [Vibrio sp.]|uniref:Aminoimidazole riboside kinase n=1 Tax=Vibrio viridaestus TaxID=2487322 RepID=A0A3N9TN81_9VIBR|nr:aminoimidazole riboside kinase [Vibrio viridaestus]MDC0610581.1 aminoimidazole riboside kinase [Vibrio sp.]RQW65115.1 aminoimidazole riboside kinase [Vibrio viridaestus]
MNKVWLTGDAVVDLIPDGESSYLKCPGGAPANVAVAISRLNGAAHFMGKAGNDPLGRFLKATLCDEKVNVDYFVLDNDQRTSTVVVDLDDEGERSFTFMVKPSADQFFNFDNIAPLQEGEWLHCCSIALANNPSRNATFSAMREIRKNGGFVSFDPNLREEVWTNPAELTHVVMDAVKLADVVKFSEEELTLLTSTATIEEGIEKLQTLNIPLILVTLGAEGTLVTFNGESFTVAAKKVSPIDTTGAGDAFVGGVLARLSQDNDWKNDSTIREAVLWGNTCGGLATTKKGAMTALPSRSELIELLKD